MFAALLQLQRRLGKDQFPLIEQHFFPNPNEIVSTKKQFIYAILNFIYSHNFKNTINKIFLTALKNVQRYFNSIMVHIIFLLLLARKISRKFLSIYGFEKLFQCDFHLASIKFVLWIRKKIIKEKNLIALFLGIRSSIVERLRESCKILISKNVLEDLLMCFKKPENQ